MSTNKEPKTKPGAIFHFTMKVHGRSEGTCAPEFDSLSSKKAIFEKLST